MTKRSRKRRPAAALVLAAALLLPGFAAPAGAEDAGLEPLRPQLLVPSRERPSASEHHRATNYRSGLKRDIRRLELRRAGDSLSERAKAKAHGRLGVQSRLNARRAELSRINRALRRGNRR